MSQTRLKVLKTRRLVLLNPGIATNSNKILWRHCCSFVKIFIKSIKMSASSEKRQHNKSPTPSLPKKVKVEAVEHVELVLNLNPNFDNF